MTRTTWLVVGIVILAIVAFSNLNLGVGDKVNISLDQTGSSCQVMYQQSLSGLTSGVTQIEQGNGNYELIVSSSDLNSANSTEIAFTLTNKRIDECRATDGTLLQSVIKYHVDASSFSNQVDTSDNSKYYTVTYVNNNDQYNITADGISYATVNVAQDVVTHSTDGSSAFSFDVEDYTTLDKGIADAEGYMTLGTVHTDGGDVVLKYRKD